MFSFGEKNNFATKSCLDHESQRSLHIVTSVQPSVPIFLVVELMELNLSRWNYSCYYSGAKLFPCRNILARINSVQINSVRVQSPSNPTVCPPRPPKDTEVTLVDIDGPTDPFDALEKPPTLASLLQ